MKRLNEIKESFQAKWDKGTGKEIYAVGARVKVAHKGRMVVGKVVRYEGNPRDGGVPFYVVDVGERESKIVPWQDTEPLREGLETTDHYRQAQYELDLELERFVNRQFSRMVTAFQIPRREAKLLIMDRCHKVKPSDMGGGGQA